MIILTRRKLFPTARSLKRAILGLGERRVYINTEAPSEFAYGTQILRWGNSAPFTGGVDLHLNDAELISIAASKLKFSRHFEEKGIPFVELKRGTPNEYPIVVRRTLTGMGGVGITVCRDASEFSEVSDCFWSPWYNFSFELGVHLLGGEPVKLFKKVGDGTAEAFPIRNARRGYHFQRVSEDSFPKLAPTLRRFHELFPIEMGRLDVGWDATHKVYRLIEFNSAPGLAENEDTLSLYADYIKRRLESYS